MSGRGGRTPSGPWSRLKPVNLDPLEAYGLPSKGDNRLLDFKTQERYYTKIVDRFMSFCSKAGRGDELLRRLASLNLNGESNDYNHDSSTTAPTAIPIAASIILPTLPLPSSSTPITTNTITALLSPDPNPTPTPTLDPHNHKDLTTLLFSLRKLREGLLASSRHDSFSLAVYTFSIRLSVSLKHYESYLPSLLHVLYTFNNPAPSPSPLQTSHAPHSAQSTPQSRLVIPSLLLQEFATYHILDLSCRQSNLPLAHQIRLRFHVHDPAIRRILACLVRGDYVTWWRLRDGVDGYKARLMEWAEEGMRLRALKCVGRSYLEVEVGWLEGVAGGRGWEMLVGDGVGWEREGERVSVRRVKAKGGGELKGGGRGEEGRLRGGMGRG